MSTAPERPESPFAPTATESEIPNMRSILTTILVAFTCASPLITAHMLGGI